MIEPVQSDEAFLEDVRSASALREILHMWWLGQSGYLVQWQGAHLLIDPYLSDSLTKKYAGTDKPHVRMTRRVVDPSRLDFIDVVTSSHNHTDHLDGETLIPLLKANPELVVVVSEANREFAADRLKISPDRLNGITGASPVKVGPFTIYAIPSAHESLETDSLGHYKCVGYAIQAGGWTIYHSGDAVPYDGLVENMGKFRIDIALLPINGRDPLRGVPGNLSGPEAVDLASAIRADLVIPMHYDMFEFNTVTPAAFRQAARRKGQAFQILKCGERFSLGGPGRATSMDYI
jgi:L-ascorbate metabolism protein UlaG (beta-lactamase superfamily)